MVPCIGANRPLQPVRWLSALRAVLLSSLDLGSRALLSSKPLGARFPLYRSKILQENTRWKALRKKEKYLILQSQKIFFEGKGSVLQSNFAILWFVVTTEGLYPNHDVSNVCFSKSKAICVEHFDEFQKQF